MIGGYQERAFYDGEAVAHCAAWEAACLTGWRAERSKAVALRAARDAVARERSKGLRLRDEPATVGRGEAGLVAGMVRRAGRAALRMI